MADKVLVASRFGRSMLGRFAERFELLETAGKPADQVFSAAELADVRALLTMGGQPLGRETFDMLPALGAVICYGTGYDGVDLKAAAERGIVVGNSPAANASAVADLALALLLALMRRVLPADAYVRAGGWSGAKPSPMLKPPRGLTGAKVGVYGIGEIGRKIAARVAGFETETRIARGVNFHHYEKGWHPTATLGVFGAAAAAARAMKLADAQVAQLWPLAAIVAETGDQIGHALATLTTNLEQATR